MQYLEFYASIFELDDVERPSDKVVEDDSALDGWYDSYTAKIKSKIIDYHREMEKRSAPSGNQGSLKKRMGSVTADGGGAASRSMG